MNSFIESQIKNMMTTVTLFRKSCEVAAMQDDGAVSREEEKFLKRIDKCSERFVSELEALLKKQKIGSR